MKKMAVCLSTCLLLAAGIWFWRLIQDRQYLDTQLIRLHIVANSNSRSDQEVKLLVRDAVLETLAEGLEQVSDVQAAKQYLSENLPVIEEAANRVLEAAGVDRSAVASLCREYFTIRAYDSFMLPSGIYESLKITLGEGEGKNWWCVAFPNLCMSASSADFETAAETSGMNTALSKTLTRNNRYHIRFYLLDALGSAKKRLLPQK